LAKASDHVNHRLLLQKLQYHGIKGEILDWFGSYSSNRKQRVDLKLLNTQNYYYSWEHVKNGVPRRSVLGPILFNAYINDLPLKISAFAVVIMFGDDTSFLISDKNYDDFKESFCDKWV
jgi:hypothetical protein